ncbi:MAG: FTR1 family protein [Candidatus Hydrothermarchaeales archaeon]
MLASFVITLREGLEAALIIGIIAAYLAKIGRRDLNKYLYLGAGGAIGASAILAIVFNAVYGGLEGKSEEIFEGIAALTATVVLTYMIFWMAKHSREIKGELQKGVDVAISTGELVKIASLSFIVVLREGVETVLFLTAAAVTEPGGTLLGFALGLVVSVSLAVMLFKGVYRLDLGKFFKYTSILLVIFAAGITVNGIHALQEGRVIPILVWEDQWTAGHELTADQAYEGILEPSGLTGTLLAMLFGYHGTGTPSFFMLVGYVGYWVLVGSYVLRTYRTAESPSPAPS